MTYPEADVYPEPTPSAQTAREGPNHDQPSRLHSDWSRYHNQTRWIAKQEHRDYSFVQAINELCMCFKNKTRTVAPTGEPEYMGPIDGDLQYRKEVNDLQRSAHSALVANI